jgi:DNA-binding transcriptional MocR family regulator
VSPATVSRAIAQLSADGVVFARPGSGTFVADRIASRAPRGDFDWQTSALGDQTVDSANVEFLLQTAAPGSIPLAGGYPHQSLLPTRALAAALARAARRPDAAERPPLEGLTALRAWFARSIGSSIDAGDVLITAGAQSAMSTALRAVVPAGGAVLVESPTYIGALAVARGARLRAIPVPMDQNGIKPDSLAERFASTGARVLYCQPAFQNPTGSVLHPGRRGEVLAVARDAGAFVIEDDFARFLPHEAGLPPPPLVADDHDGRVIHISSLTKVTSPNLRVGALIARGPVAERLRALRIVDDFFVPRVAQEAAVELLSAPAWPRHLKALSASLLQRREALTVAIISELGDSFLTQLPKGGLHMWLRLPRGLDDVAVADAARQAGVLVSPGRPYYAAEPPGPHLRLSFAATPDSAQLTEGIRRLAGSIR